MLVIHPPADFVKKLDRTFNGRLRIRWSAAKEEFHIEQKVGRAALLPFRFSEINDQFIRARDGYHFVMAIRPANYAWCRTCGLKTSVPIMVSGEIKCDYCEIAKLRRGREFGGYWPLGDALLDHLRKIDPYRDGHLQAEAEQDRALAQRERAVERNTYNAIEAATHDDARQLFGIQGVGYTGKVFTEN